MDRRDGFTPSQKSMMMLSRETREGLKLTGELQKKISMHRLEIELMLSFLQ